MTCPRHESLSGKYDELQPKAESHKVSMIHEGAPLGPDSLLWHYMDNRMMLMASAGIVQLMIPATGAGVEDHSNFYNEIVERTVRSMTEIEQVVFDLENADEIGRRIRDYHPEVKGKDHTGKRYHALDPQTFADTHLTFVDAVFQVADRLSHHDLTYGEREQLYKESITWYQHYGVSDRCLPADYRGYKVRWNEMCQNELVITDVAKRALSYAIKGQIPRPNVVPERVWNMLKLPMAPAGDVMGNMIIAGLPEQVREKFKVEIPYTHADKAQVWFVEQAIRRNWRFVPKPLRHTPQAYEAQLKANKSMKVSDRVQAVGYVIGSNVAKSSINIIKDIRSLVAP